MKKLLQKICIVFICALMCIAVIPHSVVSADEASDNVPVSASVSHMIINQIYGSQASSEYISHDFIELYNPTDESVDLEGWSVQYRASSADKTRVDLSWAKLTLTGVVPAHHSYLIRCMESSAYAGDDRIINDYDISWDIALYNKGLSVVLMSTDELIPADSAVFDNDLKKPVIEGYVDMLAVRGNDDKPAQVPEAYESAVNPWQSKKIGIMRNGFADTDDNSADTVKADYSVENISGFFPKSTKNGAWGAPADRSIKISADSGFYDSPFVLTVQTEEGKLYYTLDGSEPEPGEEFTYAYDESKGITINDATDSPNIISMRTDISAGYNLNDDGTTLAGYVSPQYNIDKCTVVRIAAFYDDGSHSDILTNSYFVGFDNRDSISNLNVLSMVADPDDLFDYDKGIYVLGAMGTFDKVHWWWSNGNFRMKGKDWERKASMEFFDTERKLIVDQTGGIRIHGGGSRGFAQKSFNLYAREEFDGNKRFNYDFFGTGYLAKKLTLSNGGDDIKSKSADYMINTLCTDDEYFGIAKMIPYALFLNGEYWGTYYLTEKYDDEYIEYYYGVKHKNVVIIKNGEVEEGNEEDMSLYDQMKSFVVNNDMSDENNYAQACNLIDIDSFVHYYATEIYIGRNMDWPISNWATWRARETGSGEYEDGRWRWLLFDLNSGSMGDGSNKNPRSVTDTCKTDGMFNSLMNNSAFRDKMYFALREIGTTSLRADVMSEFLDDYLDKYLASLESSHDRYYGKDADSGIETLINDRRTFFNNRFDRIIGDMEQYSGMHEIMRISGNTRYETSMKIADYYKENLNEGKKFDSVVIATGENFPEELAGSYLANKKNAPILMINENTASKVVSYIRENLVEGGQIYVLGGESVIASSWLGDLNYHRLSGADRYLTNIEILNEAGISGNSIFVCTGNNYADALSGSGLDYPILLVGKSLTDDQIKFLSGKNREFIIIGGPGAVSESVADQLRSYGKIADRIAGENRYDTSKQLAEKYATYARKIVVATGQNFPDGLCGGPVAYKLGSPIVLINSTNNASYGKKFITDSSIKNGLVLGGTNTLSDAVIRDIFKMSASDDITAY